MRWIHHGMVTVRGIMNNENETLWREPGRDQADDPQRGRRRGADGRVQRSQNGNYVFLVRTASPRCSRQGSTVLSRARRLSRRDYSGDESVVVDGQLLLTDGRGSNRGTRKAGA